MAIVDINSLPGMAWKNGGGITRTLAIWPEGAGLDDFIWRVSVAEVQTSGDFSIFPGVDRTILLLDGPGMILRGEDERLHSLTVPFVPYTLRGEEKIQAQLVDGCSRDFNVMVRREAAQCAVQVWEQSGDWTRDATAAVFLCARGVFQIAPCDTEPVVLLAGHAFTLNRVRAGLRAAPQRQNSVLIGAFISNRWMAA